MHGIAYYRGKMKTWLVLWAMHIVDIQQNLTLCVCVGGWVDGGVWNENCLDPFLWLLKGSFQRGWMLCKARLKGSEVKKTKKIEPEYSDQSSAIRSILEQLASICELNRPRNHCDQNQFHKMNSWNTKSINTIQPPTLNPDPPSPVPAPPALKQIRFGLTPLSLNRYMSTRCANCSPFSCHG